MSTTSPRSSDLTGVEISTSEVASAPRILWFLENRSHVDNFPFVDNRATRFDCAIDACRSPRGARTLAVLISAHDRREDHVGDLQRRDDPCGDRRAAQAAKKDGRGVVQAGRDSGRTEGRSAMANSNLVLGRNVRAAGADL